MSEFSETMKVLAIAHLLRVRLLRDHALNEATECRNNCARSGHEGMIGECACLCHKSATLCTCGAIKMAWHSDNSRVTSAHVEDTIHRFDWQPCYYTR